MGNVESIKLKQIAGPANPAECIPTFEASCLRTDEGKAHFVGVLLKHMMKREFSSAGFDKAHDGFFSK